MSPPTFSESALVLTAVLIVWQLIRRFSSKASLKNIPGPPSNSFIRGNIGQLFDINGWDFQKELREKFGRIALIHGPVGDKQLFISDPKALYHIFIKDQDAFDPSESAIMYSKSISIILTDPNIDIRMNRLTVGLGLVSTQGEQHRKQRKMMNPVFSVAHLRDMMPVFHEVANKVCIAIGKRLVDGPSEVDMLQWMARAALEMVGQSGLGYSFDSLVEEETENAYARSVKDFLPTAFQLRFFQESTLSTIHKIGTPKFRRALMNFLPHKNLHKLKDIVDAMDNNSNMILDEKKRALEKGDEVLQDKIGQGKDIISILMKANLEASERDRLDKEEVVGQMTTLIFAAMDTTSNALARTLFLLAQHPEVQEKLRREIKEAIEQYGEIPHDELMALPYLDAICRETLRLYPPVILSPRESQKDTVLPLSVPIKGRDGNDMNEIAVPKNTKIIASILHANTDSVTWGPDALEWKPERWLSPLPESVKEAHIPGVYSNLMTFIGGGRSCIGFKFSQLEMKVVLSVLMGHFRFSPSKEIIWEMGIITIPTLEGKPGKAVLPLKVELIA